MSAVNIAELLSNVLTSTLKAEQQGFEKYLSILKELESLGNVAFTYYDEDGLEQTLEVPILTLVPLTMLHIEEAVFDFSLKVTEKDSTSMEGSGSPSLSQGASSSIATTVAQQLQNITNQVQNAAQRAVDAAGVATASNASVQVTRPTSDRVTRPSLDRNEVSRPTTSQVVRPTAGKRPSTNVRVASSGIRPTSSVDAVRGVIAANQLVNRYSDLNVQVTSDKEDTTNLKVTVEMGQTDLTAGLIAMLQRKNNSINE